MVEGGAHEKATEAKSLTQCIAIDSCNLPFSTYSMMAGSTLTLLGDNVVSFNSDKPLECMTLLYDKDPNMTFNYFSCKTCGTNCKESQIANVNIGICENCRDGCHKGHVLLPHLMNHRPTWACCYCMKKDLCQIANKKRP
jgi:hypothetical protein